MRIAGTEEMPVRGAVGVVAVVVSLVVVGCSSGPQWLTKSQRRTAERVVALPNEEMREEFRKLDLETQYAVFRYGMDTREPPAMGLASLFAERGEGAVRLVRVRLSTDEDDVGVRDAIILVLRLKTRGTYDVTGDAQLMTLLKAKTDRMVRREVRLNWEELLRELEGDTKGAR